MMISWKKLKTSHVFLSFIVCSNGNRSALVCELLSNNSLSVSQLYEDKSLVLIYYSDNNSLLELIYFLIINCFIQYFEAHYT